MQSSTIDTPLSLKPTMIEVLEHITISSAATLNENYIIPLFHQGHWVEYM